MINTSQVVLSDELERQLMLQAMQEQFRPHPLRALFAGLRKLARISRPTAGNAAEAQAA